MFLVYKVLARAGESYDARKYAIMSPKVIPLSTAKIYISFSMRAISRGFFFFPRVFYDAECETRNFVPRLSLKTSLYLFM